MSATLSRSLTLAAACWGDLSEQAAFDRTIEVRCASASPDEKAAVRSILYCALRRAVFLERLVAKLVSRRPTPEVAALLAVSLSELNEQPDKPYVVVNEAINAARMNNATYRASGLINACLRRYLREKAALDKTILADRIARYNAPGWWIDRMRKEFGPQNLDTLFETLHKKPPMTLRVNVRKTSVEKWLTDAQAAGCPARALGGQAVLLEKARPVHRIPGFAEGLVSVQDAGAQLAGLFLAPKAGERILDACAAPGGKSFAAAIQMRGEGRIVSCDVQGKKLRRIEEGASRLGIGCIETRQMDARRPAEELLGAMDVVIADAPCSGLGVIRKKPEIRFKPESELSALPGIQLDILRGLAACVKPGGTLLYSTCTLRKCENEDVVAAFLTENSGFKALEMRTLWPDIDDTDGFFLCRLVRST